MPQDLQSSLLEVAIATSLFLCFVGITVAVLRLVILRRNPEIVDGSTAPSSAPAARHLLRRRRGGVGSARVTDTPVPGAGVVAD